MKTRLAVLFLASILGLTACGKGAAPPSGPAPTSQPQATSKPSASATTEQARMPNDLSQLRKKVAFPILVPTNVPAGLKGAIWNRPDLLPMVHVRYVSEDGKEGLLVANGPSGSGLDAVAGKTGESVQIRGGVTAHYLVNQPEFGGPILWWNQWRAYVAISGPDLTKEDLVRIANSMSPTGSLEGPATDPARSEGVANLEQYVQALFKGEATSDADARRIIATLPRFNWAEYDRLSGGRVMDLLGWLDKRRIDDVAEMTCVLDGTTGLDGAWSESYSNVVGTLFSSNPEKFVQALGTLPEDQADLIISFVGYYAGPQPDIPPARERLRALLNSSVLTTQEAERAEKLLRVLDM